MSESEPVTNPSPLVVSPAGAAHRLSVSRQFVYTLIADGELPSLKIGRARRIRVRDLEDLIDRKASDS